MSKVFHNGDKLTGIPNINWQYADLEHFIIENMIYSSHLIVNQSDTLKHPVILIR
jgi:hypothetical protein